MSAKDVTWESDDANDEDRACELCWWHGGRGVVRKENGRVVSFVCMSCINGLTFAKPAATSERRR